MNQMPPIKKMIAEGEHLMQDFKFAVNDSKKIARSLAAFANTSGGRLLLGVKDNGNIAGVRSDEEYYMVEAAAQMYCKPPVTFEAREWKYEGKTVLEIKVEKSAFRLHTAPNKEGCYVVYVRVEDENIVVNDVYIDAVKKQEKPFGNLIKVTKPVQRLFNLMKVSDCLTLSQICKQAPLKRNVAKKILSDLIAANVIEIHFKGDGVMYSSNRFVLE